MALTQSDSPLVNQLNPMALHAWDNRQLAIRSDKVVALELFDPHLSDRSPTLTFYLEGGHVLSQVYDDLTQVADALAFLGLVYEQEFTDSTGPTTSSGGDSFSRPPGGGSGGGGI